MQLLLALAISLGSTTPTLYARAAAGQCLSGLRSALLVGGFSGSTDCQQDRLSLAYVGRVQKFGRSFQIYSYRYSLKPICPECAVHGGQRIILMESGHYVGQYKPDFVRAAVRNGNLVLLPTGSVHGRPVIIAFTRNGPAKRLLVDGEIISFFK
ncbi:MAG: hypothetical protein ABIQ66_01270 [Novosphingobium sp.]